MNETYSKLFNWFKREREMIKFDTMFLDAQNEVLHFNTFEIFKAGQIWKKNLYIFSSSRYIKSTEKNTLSFILYFKDEKIWKF